MGCLSLTRGWRWRRGVRARARPAAIVVLAAAEIAGHAERLRVAVDDDDRVDAIFMTRPAVIFN